MADITAQGKIPLLVGGTMLYYKALIEGLSPSLPSADENLRLEIQEKRKNLAGQYFIKNYKKLIPFQQSVLIQMIHNALIAH